MSTTPLLLVTSQWKHDHPPFAMSYPSLKSMILQHKDLSREMDEPMEELEEVQQRWKEQQQQRLQEQDSRQVQQQLQKSLQLQQEQEQERQEKELWEEEDVFLEQEDSPKQDTIMDVEVAAIMEQEGPEQTSVVAN
ncbi:hypothetical protein DACRYDRAFT_109047 [Dacryopinax primogenitus]|uniref:Uncharacterized protein n=1 Tax=Dacryopinax primogenitus (strain DJM 731) TaxID=1858805 RepID=M5G943_DACPD|nr:uncharacterized protein DACRYDRAFT_109047 [Dacryopinax primogenitus]EJU00308.1 hypothetical protein DACRYDRAFT_109047 [Dacryopinax primogenitus]